MVSRVLNHPSGWESWDGRFSSVLVYHFLFKSKALLPRFRISMLWLRKWLFCHLFTSSEPDLFESLKAVNSFTFFFSTDGHQSALWVEGAYGLAPSHLACWQECSMLNSRVRTGLLLQWPRPRGVATMAAGGGSEDPQGLADGRWFLVNWKPWLILVWWFTELKHGDFP